MSAGHHQTLYAAFNGGQLDGAAIAGHDQEFARVKAVDPAAEGFFQHRADEQVQGNGDIVNGSGFKAPREGSGKTGQGGRNLAELVMTGKEVALRQPEQREYAA